MFKINYKLTGTGWSETTITDGTNEASLSASYLSDALGNLANAVIKILKGEKEARASFDEEPGEYRWVFTNDNNVVDIKIFSFKDLWTNKNDSEGDLVFSSKITTKELGNAILECLKNILKEYSPEEYKKKWIDHEFPMAQYSELEKLVDSE
jgi:hypothetical protein